MTSEEALDLAIDADNYSRCISAFDSAHLRFIQQRMDFEAYAVLIEKQEQEARELQEAQAASFHANKAMKIDDYQHLNVKDTFSISLTIPEVAKRVCDLNYGAQRFLSALVHELRQRNEEFEASYAQRSGQTVSKPSKLADGIEALLNEGLFH